MPSSNGSTSAPAGAPALSDRLPGASGQADVGAAVPGAPMSGALDRLNRLSPPWDEIALTRLLGDVATDFGFSHAAVLSVPSTDDGGTATRLLLSNWSENFGQAYEQLGLHRSKLVVGALKTDPMPFVWDIDTLYGADEPDPSPAARMLLEAEYLAGAFFPVHGLTAFNGALSFAGRSCALPAEAIRELHLFAFALFGMLAAARFEENRRNNPLSVRERDCLKLAMLGKTSSEIGIILSLSEYTISQYLTAAQRKLDASNRTHAVALAAQLGYLS